METSQPLPQSFPYPSWKPLIGSSRCSLAGRCSQTRPTGRERSERPRQRPGLGAAAERGATPGAAPPAEYLELEGAFGALGDLLVEALLGVVGQLERDLGGPSRAGRQRPQQQQGRQRPPGAPRRHSPARREVRRARKGSGRPGLRGCERDAAWPKGRASAPGSARAAAAPSRSASGTCVRRGRAGKRRARGGNGAAGDSAFLPVVSSCRVAAGGWVSAQRHCPQVKAF